MGSDTELRIEATVAGSRLELACSYETAVPYFDWAFAGFVRRSVRDMLAYRAQTIASQTTGEPAPTEPKHPWWSPPSAMTTDQIRVIATLSLMLAIIEYGNSLLTQTVDYVATTYAASDAQLGVVTALTRVGTIVAVIGGALADRVGRRRVLLAAISIVLVATILSAAAPNLFAFGALQVFVNGGTNLAFGVAFIAAIEEAPEASRTYTLAIVGIAAGLGFVLGALLLPLADLAPGAWRGLYAGAALGLLFLPSISRNLSETKRYTALAARNAPRGRVAEVVDRRYGGRFALLCLTGFLLNVFFAPQSQFTNRYLGEERGFSGLGILGLRALTQALPALAAAYIGGRLAESTGRRPIAVRGLIVGAFTTAAFFMFGGPALWLMLCLSTASTSLAGPSLAAFSTELFPTEVRGTAGAGLTMTAVLGSASGLLLAGYLSEPLGSIGYGVAVTSVAPLIVVLFLIKHLPEAKGVLLDDVSPSEV